MSSRFFCDTPIDGDTAVLTGAEAHHLLHVMRGKVGARVTLFDGSGAEFEAEVSGLGRSDVSLALLARNEVDRELPHPLTLGVAMPKGDRQKVLVEKLTELGVSRLTPLETERSVVGLKAPGLEKLRRLVIEASKQCGRNRLMAITAPMGFDAFLGDCPAETKLIAHPGREGGFRGAAGDVAVVVGPEGGFTDGEIRAAEHAGWRRVSLGPRILRIETAAITAAALGASGAAGE